MHCATRSGSGSHEVMVSAPSLPISEAALSPLADPLVLLAIAVGILGVIYLCIRHFARRRDHISPTPMRAESQMHDLVQALEDASRQLSAQVDARAAHLESLIADADARSAALSSLLARAKAHDISQKIMGAADPTDSGLGALARHRDIYDLADSGDTPTAIAQKLGRPAGEIELILALRGS